MEDNSGTTGGTALMVIFQVEERGAGSLVDAGRTCKKEEERARSSSKVLRLVVQVAVQVVFPEQTETEKKVSGQRERVHLKHTGVSPGRNVRLATGTRSLEQRFPRVLGQPTLLTITEAHKELLFMRITSIHLY